MPQAGPRAIRVFISSTFRDMQAERDELVKRVFPQIRKRCEQRGVAWSEVDLRWGVTDEQKAEGAVLPICLAEIERTRPYFIGLLGQRYGWVPDEVPGALVDSLGWLADDYGRSVTELEILHGVLNDPDAAGHAYFYLRDPAWLDTVAPEERGTFVEESPDGAARLEALRQRVLASSHPARIYADPATLGDQVLADLTALVERLYPETEPPGPVAASAAGHRAFAAARTPVRVARPALEAALDAHVTGTGRPLLVWARSGNGVSSMVAGWAEGWRARNPQDLVVEHYVEADVTASDHRTMVERLVAALADATGTEPPPVGETTASQRGALTRTAAALGPRRAVVVIDAVDRLNDRDGAPDLRWLPAELPATLRLVLTATSARPRAAAAVRELATLEVPPLSATEQRELVDRFLARYAKALDPANIDRLLASPNAGHARFLVTVLDELRQHGDHFTLAPLVDRLGAATTVDDLFELVLARYEQDYERDRPGLVADAMRLVWAARTGLTEGELLALLGGSGEPLPAAIWAPLHLAAEQGLISRDGVLGFASTDLRTAVADRYLSDPNTRRATHAQLAAFFAGREPSTRVADERGWQQVASGDWDGLGSTLADLELTALAHRHAPYDLRRLWAVARNHGLQPTTVYAAVLADPAAHDTPDGDLVWGIAALLAAAGSSAEAIRLQRHLVDAARRHPAGRTEGPDGDARLRAALVNLGAAHTNGGELVGAVTTLTEAVQRCRAAADQAMLAAALGNLALAHRMAGEHGAAETLFAEEAALCLALDDPFGLQASLANRATLLLDTGRHDEALTLLEEQERLCRLLGDDAAVARARAGQASVLATRGDVDRALVLTADYISWCRHEGDERGLLEGLLNQAAMSQRIGASTEAISASAEAEPIARRLGDNGLLAQLLCIQASAAATGGNWAVVEHLAREAELTARTAGLLAPVAQALSIIGTARREQGDLAGCRSAHTEELAIASAVGDPEAVAQAQINLGNVAIAEQRLDEAVQLYGAAEAALLPLQASAALLTLYANRAQIHHTQGRFPEALADYTGAADRAALLGDHGSAHQWGQAGIQLAYQLGDTGRAETLWRALATAARGREDQAGLQLALGERALLLIGRAQPAAVGGDPTTVDQTLLAEAATLLDEQEQICRRIGDDNGLAACVGNRAIVLRYQGDLHGSLACLDEQLQLAQQAGNGQGVLFATANRGEVLGLLGRTAEALAALRSARDTATRANLAPMVQQLDAMIRALGG